MLWIKLQIIWYSPAHWRRPSKAHTVPFLVEVQPLILSALLSELHQGQHVASPGLQDSSNLSSKTFSSSEERMKPHVIATYVYLFYNTLTCLHLYFMSFIMTVCLAHLKCMRTSVMRLRVKSTASLGINESLQWWQLAAITKPQLYYYRTNQSQWGKWSEQAVNVPWTDLNLTLPSGHCKFECLSRDGTFSFKSKSFFNLLSD